MLSRPGDDQPIDDLANTELRQPRKVDDLRRRERVQLEVRISRLDRAEQILVPRERQVGVVAALQQQLHAADLDRLVDFPEDLFEPEHVAFARSHVAVERAEVALRDADVRVVDVAVDDVGDRAIRVLAQTDLVGKPPEHVRGRVLVERKRLVRVHASALGDLPFRWRQYRHKTQAWSACADPVPRPRPPTRRIASTLQLALA